MKLSFLVSIMLLLLPSLYTQSPVHFNQHVVGFQISYSYWNQILPEGEAYDPTVFSLYGAKMLHQKNPKAYRWYLMWEPHWGRVRVGEKIAREIGIVPGIGIQLRLTSTTMLYAEGGAGPKFITVRTRRQARGFTFTDNFVGGIRQRLFNLPVELRLHWRARHISNGSFQQPNGGINNFFWGGGVYMLLGK